ncbi:MAG: hypothetical protein ACUVQM_05255 [Candidatus Hadarchaeaceae archaeon]
MSDYSIICRRINSLELYFERSLRELADDIVVAIDALRMKMTNCGEWRHEVCGSRSKRGYLKIHVAVDTKME